MPASAALPPEADPPAARIVVVVPALNEERAVGGVVRGVLAALDGRGSVLVVDNGSTDATAQRAREAGGVVVSEPRRGYGSACLRGLAALAEFPVPPEVVVFLDADASDDPAALPALVDPILAGRSDFVLGSRMLGERERGSMPPVAVFGNHLASWLLRTLWRAPYTDLGPFRAIRYDKLLELGMTDRDYGWTIEMQIKALRHGLRVEEVPVPYRQRIGKSKISGTIRGSCAAGVKILTVLARHGMRR